MSLLLCNECDISASFNVMGPRSLLGLDAVHYAELLSVPFFCVAGSASKQVSTLMEIGSGWLVELQLSRAGSVFKLHIVLEEWFSCIMDESPAYKVRIII